MTFSELLDKKTVVLDGAMGTMLQASGAYSSRNPELVNIENPEAVRAVHRAYAEAGSDILYANSFSVNRYTAARSGRDLRTLIAAALENARLEARGGILVGLDVSSLGELLEPFGELSEEEAFEAFSELGELGEQEGADLIALETFADARELGIAVKAVRQACRLPVLASMSFGENGFTFIGSSPEELVKCASEADAIGINCSLGPDKLRGTAERLRAAAGEDKPLIFKPNAGLPDARGRYGMPPERFAGLMKPYAEELGYKFLGGCCGTTDRHIRALCDIL